MYITLIIIYICTAFTDLDNMDVHLSISQHETHIIIKDTGQNQDEDNQGNIGKDIHNCVIHFVEAQQEVGEDSPWEQRPIQCSNNDIEHFVSGKS